MIIGFFSDDEDLFTETKMNSYLVKIEISTFTKFTMNYTPKGEKLGMENISTRDWEPF
ncbi:hypothetical protein JOD24_000173 [Kroppenstedtia sanguinis]